MASCWQPLGTAAARVMDQPNRKRTDLARLRARYDSGVVNAAVYAVIKQPLVIMPLSVAVWSFWQTEGHQ